MSPVVDPRKQQAKDKNSNHPAAHLFVDHLAIVPPSAFAVVECRSDKTAKGGRCTYGEGNTREIRDNVSPHTAESVNGYQTVPPIFLKDEGCNLLDGYHVEKNVENPSVEIVCGQQGPPSMETINGNGAGSTQKKKTAIVGGQESERIHGKAHGCGIHEDGENEHSRVDIDDVSHEIITADHCPRPEIVFENRARMGQTAMRTARLVTADELPAIGA